MKEIKIGRKTFLIKPGDYILFNGACYQFCTGDKRSIYFKGWSSYSSIVIPKSVLKKIDLSKLEKAETGNIEDRSFMTKYYFK